MCILDGNSWEREFSGKSVQKSCIFRSGRGKIYRHYSTNVYFYHLFVNGKMGEHSMLEWVYCCVVEHLILRFILCDSRKHQFILANIIFYRHFFIPNNFIQIFFQTFFSLATHANSIGVQYREEDTAFGQTAFLAVFTI